MKTQVNQSGRSMIEMLGVLAIIGVLSVGGIAGYSKAMGKFKTNAVVDQVSMIVTNIRTLYAQQMDYNGLNNVNAVNLGVIPDDLINKSASTSQDGKYYSAVNLRNGFQGDVTVFASDSRSAETTGAKNAFVVQFDGLSRDACVSLSTSDWGSGTSSGFIALSVANTKISADTTASTYIGCPGVKATAYGSTQIACPGGATQKMPLSVTDASLACSCGNTNSCSIQWKYY